MLLFSRMKDSPISYFNTLNYMDLNFNPNYFDDLYKFMTIANSYLSHKSGFYAKRSNAYIMTRKIFNYVNLYLYYIL